MKSDLLPCFGKIIHEVDKSHETKKQFIAFLDVLNYPNPLVQYTIGNKKENKQLNFLDSHKENRK